MGGEIWVDSEEGRGSNFQFYLNLTPVSGEDAANFRGEDITDASDSPDETFDYRILVAEDDTVNQEVVSQLLKKMGCRVEIAANGSEALALLESSTFDLVFMDVQMPVMNRLDTVRQLRQSSDYQHLSNIPVIALTAHAYERDRKACLEAGMDSYLSKPVSFTELYTIIKKVKHGNLQGKTIGTAAKAESENGDVVNLDAVSERLGGEKEVVLSVIRKYLETAPHYLGKIFEAVKKNDYERVREYAHTLKSASANIGGERACTAAESVERAALDKDDRPLGRAVSTLTFEVNAVLGVLPQLCADLRAPVKN